MNFCAVTVAILADLPPYTSDVEAMRSRPLTLFVKPMWEMYEPSTDLTCQTGNVFKTNTYTQHDKYKQV